MDDRYFKSEKEKGYVCFAYQEEGYYQLTITSHRGMSISPFHYNANLLGYYTSLMEGIVEITKEQYNKDIVEVLAHQSNRLM